MMNRYESALNELEEYIIDSIIDDGVLSLNHFNEQINAIKELVERHKPMKLDYDRGFPECRNCYHGFHDEDLQEKIEYYYLEYCPVCGQALDWSEYE